MIHIETAQQLKDNINLLETSKYVGLDSETTGLDPLQDKLRLIQLSDGNNTLVIDVFKVGREAVSAFLRPILESKDVVKILHNAKFDLKFIKHQLNIDVERIFDSMLCSILIEGGLAPMQENGKRSFPKGFHGLEQVAERYLNRKVNKEEQKSDWSGTLTQEQLEYAGNDAEVMLPLREAIIEKLKENKLIKVAKLEFEAVLPVAWMELNGIFLDIDQWMAVANDQLQKSYQYEEEVCRELKDVIPQGSLFGEPTINLGSYQQVQKYFSAYGIPMPSSTKEQFLLPLEDEYPIIKTFLKYKKASKAHSSFGEKYKEFINPVSGRVHANFIQIGAETGRFACSNPNLMQIPKDKEHRNCFRAEEGNVFIICDYGQQELRLLADFSQDKALQEVFNSGIDFHIATAAKIFKKLVDDVTHDDRELAKRMNYLLTYGGGAQKFSELASIPKEQAQAIIDAYFAGFKGVKRWMNYQQAQVLNTRQARSMYNRMAKYAFDYDNFRERSGAQRNASNMPLQSSAADILKRVLRLFYEAVKPYNNKIKLVNIVHDELIVETDINLLETASNLLKECMQQAWKENIKSVGIDTEVKVTTCWQKG